MAKQAYESLTAMARSNNIMKWTAQEQDAQATHAEDILKMDLFDVHFKQGNPVMIII
jgi:hypothetical protein